MFDVIVFGATGFTGRLIAEYLVQLNAAGSQVRWAMAGRNMAKLQEIHAQIGANQVVGLLSANTNDSASLDQLVQQTKVIISTVGPYQLYGESLLKACAKHGTDYLDLCGEPLWMAKMIPLVDEMARKSGARILFSSGFDSIPFDLGVIYLQDQAMSKYGRYFTKVSGRVKSMKGTFSGGTVASMMATLAAVGKDTSLLQGMKNSFLLTPGFQGPKQMTSHVVKHDDVLSNWCTPFVMAPINLKNVHRTNFLQNHLWGTDFQYDEMVLTGAGTDGEKRAHKLAKKDGLQQALLYFGPTRWLLGQFVLPKPGQGPNKEQRDNGSFEILFHGNDSNQVMLASVKGFQDPGYGCTSKMITQSALCLIEQFPKAQLVGGVYTPGAALGQTLIKRLHDLNILHFALKHSKETEL
jgi:short subunit dehydrogenase-like uncharacterized protein